MKKVNRPARGELARGDFYYVTTNRFMLRHHKPLKAGSNLTFYSLKAEVLRGVVVADVFHNLAERFHFGCGVLSAFH